MIAPLRRRHRQIWLLLAGILPILLGLALEGPWRTSTAAAPKEAGEPATSPPSGDASGFVARRLGDRLELSWQEPQRAPLLVALWQEGGGELDFARARWLGALLPPRPAPPTPPAPGAPASVAFSLPTTEAAGQVVIYSVGQNRVVQTLAVQTLAVQTPAVDGTSRAASGGLP